MVKLSDEDVKAIRTMYYKEGKTYTEISKLYGVSRQCIQQRISYKRKSIKSITLKEQNTKLLENIEFLKSVIKKYGIDITREGII